MLQGPWSITDAVWGKMQVCTAQNRVEKRTISQSERKPVFCHGIETGEFLDGVEPRPASSNIYGQWSTVVFCTILCGQYTHGTVGGQAYTVRTQSAMRQMNQIRRPEAIDCMTVVCHQIAASALR